MEDMFPHAFFCQQKMTHNIIGVCVRVLCGRDRCNEGLFEERRGEHAVREGRCSEGVGPTLQTDLLQSVASA